MSQREIEEKLGVSTSGLNYCLNELKDKVYLKVQNFSQYRISLVKSIS
jgi:predicted transcriptional regulator